MSGKLSFKEIKDKSASGGPSKYANLVYSDFCNSNSKELKLVPIDMGYGDPAANQFVPKVLHDYIIDELSKKNAGAYPNVQGEQILVDKYKEYIKNDEGLSSDYHLAVISGGGRSGITNSLKVFIDSKDIILIPYPAWSGYKSLAKFLDAIIYPIHTSMDNRFTPSGPDIEAAIKGANKDFPDSKTKLMILNTPHNPTGTVFYHDSIREILKVLNEKEIFCLADYTYRAIRDSESSMPSVHKVAEEIEFEEQLPKGTYTDYIVAMQTLGKPSLTPGFRLGYVATTNEVIIKRFCTNKQATDFSGNLFMQQAFAKYLLTEHQVKDFKNTVEVFEKRRSALLNELKEYGYSPENNNILLSKSGFYVSFEVPKKYHEELPLSTIPELMKTYPFIKDCLTEEEYLNMFKSKGYIPPSEIFVLELIKNTAINILPGHLFSPEISNPANEYEKWVRVALIEDENSIKEAFNRIKNKKEILTWD